MAISIDTCNTELGSISQGSGGTTIVTSTSPEISVLESPADTFNLTFNANVSKMAALKFDFTAGETISALKLVYVNIADGKIYVASSTAAFANAMVVGIATNASVSGGFVTVQLSGIIQDASWSWSANALLFCSSTGYVTNVAPAAPGYRIKIAKAITSDTILLNIEEPILLT